MTSTSKRSRWAPACWRPLTRAGSPAGVPAPPDGVVSSSTKRVRRSPTIPTSPLLGLAQTLCVSPHHLSRTFRSLTGETIARHRLRLRVRTVLERLARGEHHLARLAADVGFSDQSHLCRAVRSETGTTPSALRHALR